MHRSSSWVSAVDPTSGVMYSGLSLSPAFYPVTRHRESFDECLSSDTGAYDTGSDAAANSGLVNDPNRKSERPKARRKRNRRRPQRKKPGPSGSAEASRTTTAATGGGDPEGAEAVRPADLQEEGVEPMVDTVAHVEMSPKSAEASTQADSVDVENSVEVKDIAVSAGGAKAVTGGVVDAAASAD